MFDLERAYLEKDVHLTIVFEPLGTFYYFFIIITRPSCPAR